MKIKIIHETVYEFNNPVTIQPHYLRFTPKITPYNQLENYSLWITPNPLGLSRQIDSENNMVHFCWFNGLYKQLTIHAESNLVLQENNPFNFILFPDTYFYLPFHYQSDLLEILNASLIVPSIAGPLIEYGNQILERSMFNTLSFITNLTSQIHIDFVAEQRLIGEPFIADKTFALKKGSCRDLSWMQIQLLRFMGIAARFTSGYYYTNMENSLYELHGWLEVYLPGAGWIGFDPSNGIIAGNTHIPVCSSSRYENTMPVTGSFVGNTDSFLKTSLFMGVI